MSILIHRRNKSESSNLIGKITNVVYQTKKVNQGQNNVFLPLQNKPVYYLTQPLIKQQILLSQFPVCLQQQKQQQSQTTPKGIATKKFLNIPQLQQNQKKQEQQNSKSQLSCVVQHEKNKSLDDSNHEQNIKQIAQEQHNLSLTQSPICTTEQPINNTNTSVSSILLQPSPNKEQQPTTEQNNQQKKTIHIIIISFAKNKNEQNVRSQVLSALNLTKSISHSHSKLYVNKQMDLKDRKEFKDCILWFFDIWMNPQDAENLLTTPYVEMQGAQIFFKDNLIVDDIYCIQQAERFKELQGINVSYDDYKVDFKGNTYYIYQRKVNQLEDKYIDYKFYSIHNEDNMQFLTKLITAYLNADRIERDIAGTILIGVHDKERRIMGHKLQAQDIELFKENFLEYISQNTYPDVHGYVKVSAHEVILYDQNKKTFLPLKLFESNQDTQYILEISIERIKKDPMIIMKEKKDDLILQQYYQRKASSNRLLKPEELCKYVPERISQQALSNYIMQCSKTSENKNKEIQELKQQVDLLTQQNQQLNQQLLDNDIYYSQMIQSLTIQQQLFNFTNSSLNNISVVNTVDQQQQQKIQQIQIQQQTNSSMQQAPAEITPKKLLIEESQQIIEEKKEEDQEYSQQQQQESLPSQQEPVSQDIQQQQQQQQIQQPIQPQAKQQQLYYEKDQYYQQNQKYQQHQTDRQNHQKSKKSNKQKKNVSVKSLQYFNDNDDHLYDNQSGHSTRSQSRGRYNYVQKIYVKVEEDKK